MKKDRNYIPIFDKPIEELKKPNGEPIDFDNVMNQLLGVNGKSEGQQPLEHH